MSRPPCWSFQGIKRSSGEFINHMWFDGAGTSNEHFGVGTKDRVPYHWLEIRLGWRIVSLSRSYRQRNQTFGGDDVEA